MISWHSLKGLSTPILNNPTWFVQFKRTVFVLRRTRQLKLNSLDADYPKKLKKKSFYYELVENTDCKKKPLLEIVLTQDIPGVGLKGEKLDKNMYTAYRDLLLPKLAVYANSPEGKALRKVTEEKQYTSIYSKIVENYLFKQPVVIIMSNDVQWTLQPWHVKFALRKSGILTNEDCITIPQEISGPDPNIENKDFLIYLTMNKSDRFPVRCRIYHWSSLEPAFNQKSIDIHSISEPLFLDEKNAIDSLIKTEQEIKKIEKLKGYVSGDKKRKK